jgi:Flp pilus assembly protein TadG
MCKLAFNVRLTRDDRGSQAVEFAILVPVLLLITLGIVTFGFVFNAQITATQAAREGARLAAICGQDASCLGNVKAQVEAHAPGLTLSDSQISVTSCPANAPTASATVTITYVENLGIPPLATGITLHGTASTPCGG